MIHGTWTREYCGVSHLEIPKGQSIRLVTMCHYPEHTEIHIFGPTGFSTIHEKIFKGKDRDNKAKEYGEQYAAELGVRFPGSENIVQQKPPMSVQQRMHMLETTVQDAVKRYELEIEAEDLLERAEAVIACLGIQVDELKDKIRSKDGQPTI